MFNTEEKVLKKIFALDFSTFQQLNFLVLKLTFDQIPVFDENEISLKDGVKNHTIPYFPPPSPLFLKLDNYGTFFLENYSEF